LICLKKREKKKKVEEQRHEHFFFQATGYSLGGGFSNPGRLNAESSFFFLPENSCKTGRCEESLTDV